MSFKAANQAVQSFIINSRYAFPSFDNIKAVLDARRLNTTILETASEKEGKLRKIKISHYPVDCNSVADTCNANICDSGAILEPVQEWFLLSKCMQSKPAKLRIQDVRDVDGIWNFSEHAMAQIRAKMGALDKELAKEIDSTLLANVGLHLNGLHEIRVTMSNTTNGLMTPLGLWQIEKEFSDGGYINPFIIGSTEVFNWKKALGIATQNTSLGQDFAKLGDTNMYYDTVLNSVIGVTTGGEYVIAFDPQALKFVSYCENVGIFATDNASPAQMDALYKSGNGHGIMKGVFMNPTNGLLWDFFLRFDECDGEDGSFTWYMRLKWDIFFPRIESCNIQGVNGIFLYKTCPVVVPVCPSGDTPSPAATAATYNWNPSFSYPLLISDITIGGIKSEPNVNVANDTDLTAALNDAYGLPIFSLSGANIKYTGYSAITGNINAGNVVITFS